LHFPNLIAGKSFRRAIYAALRANAALQHDLWRATGSSDLKPGRGIEQPRYLNALSTQLVNHTGMLDDHVAFKRDPEEEL
jgi:hypothetical protein